MLNIYTDGSCVNNGLKTATAGWSFVVTTKEDNMLLASTGRVYGKQDNNRAELTALIRGLEYAKNDNRVHRGEKYTIFTDFEMNYLLYKGKIEAKKNLDLINQIQALFRQCSDFVTVEKVKAHEQTNMFEFINGIADKLARKNANINAYRRSKKII